MSYHRPARKHRLSISSPPIRRPIYQHSPLLSLPDEILLRILHYIIALETPLGRLTFPNIDVSCACVPLVPVPPPPRRRWTARRIYAALRKPWYYYCMRMCDRLDLWAGDPELPHFQPPGTVVNLAIMRTCLRIHPLAVEVLYALNTITFTSREVENMLKDSPGTVEFLRNVRVVERKVEESRWVQQVDFEPHVSRVPSPGEKPPQCCGSNMLANARTLWTLLRGKRLQSLVIDLEPFVMCPKRGLNGEFGGHNASPMRCLEAFGIGWGCEVVSKGIGRYLVRKEAAIEESREQVEMKDEGELRGWQDPKSRRWRMRPASLQTLPVHKLKLIHLFMLSTWKEVAAVPKPLLHEYAVKWSPEYLHESTCPWYPKTPLCRITRDLMFAEMAAVVDDLHQHHLRYGGGAAVMRASQYLGQALRTMGTENVSARWATAMEIRKVLPAEDPRWNHTWTEAFAMKVVESRWIAEKAVKWEARRR